MATLLARRVVLWLGIALMAMGAAFAAYDATTSHTAGAFLLGFAITWAHESAKHRTARAADP